MLQARTSHKPQTTTSLVAFIYAATRWRVFQSRGVGLWPCRPYGRDAFAVSGLASPSLRVEWHIIVVLADSESVTRLSPDEKRLRGQRRTPYSLLLLALEVGSVCSLPRFGQGSRFSLGRLDLACGFFRFTLSIPPHTLAFTCPLGASPVRLVFGIGIVIGSGPRVQNLTGKMSTVSSIN